MKPAWVVVAPGVRPRLIAQRRPLIAILSAVACVVFCLLFLWLMDLGVPHASARGEHLNLATLAANEQIIVRHVRGARGDPPVFRFLIGGQGNPRGIVIGRERDPWSNETGIEVLAAGTLTDEQAEGLETVVEFFRARREEHSFHPDLYGLVYYRDGTKIGEEHFVGFRLAWELGELHRFGPSGEYDFEYEMGRLSRYHDVPRAQLDRVMTFDMIRELMTKQ